MPTLRRPLLDVYWHTLKVRHAHPKRSIAIFNEIGLHADREENIEAYEKRHQRFLQALRGESALKEDNSTVTGKNVASDVGKRLDKSGVKSVVPRKLTLGRKPWANSVVRPKSEEETNLELSRAGTVGSSKKAFFDAHLSPDRRGFKRWTPPQSNPEASAEAQQQHTEPQTESAIPSLKPQMPSEPINAKRGEPKKPPTSPKLSLFEELFPDEVEKPVDRKYPLRSRPRLPKLPLPDFQEDDDKFEDEYVTQRRLHCDTTGAASKDAFQRWNLAMLILQVASPSLAEDDFRRIAPKGQHISDWVGPGDIFKVIPARDPTTLQQETHYFLVFPNPSYARAYQTHVRRLHNLAQKHTPSSIESTMAPPEGMIVQGEDVHNLLQNYTLLPASQKLSLISLFPPYSVGIQRLLEHRGYPELTSPKDKTGRCVLFWVEGFVPTIMQVQQLIRRDSKARGLAWALLDGKYSIQQLEPDAGPDLEVEEEDRKGMERHHANSERAGQDFFDYYRRTLIRWTIAFQDENEARRFVRRWHLRPFSEVFTDREHKGDVKPLVHAEFMW